MPIIKPVNYLGSKEFSNKNFRFKMNFYDHNMADVLVRFKFLYRKWSVAKVLQNGIP